VSNRRNSARFRVTPRRNVTLPSVMV
jgi:hypothetical protein